MGFELNDDFQSGNQTFVNKELFNECQTAFQIFSSLSVIFSGLVTLSGLMFPRQLLSASRPISNTIFWISTCDLVASFVASFGFPPMGTFCEAQGFLFSFAIKCSWIWTCFLVFQIRSTLIFKKIFLAMPVMHCATWSLSLVLTMLPFSTQNHFGIDGYTQHLTICNYDGYLYTKFVWISITFYGFLAVCFLLLCSFLGHVWYHLNFVDAGFDRRSWQIFQATRYYPVAMVAVWSPALINFFVVVVANAADMSPSTTSGQQFFCVSNAIFSTDGLFRALIFVYHSPQIRHLWVLRICGHHWRPHTSQDKHPNDELPRTTMGDHDKFGVVIEDVASSRYTGGSNSRPSNTSNVSGVTDMTNWDDFRSSISSQHTDKSSQSPWSSRSNSRSNSSALSGSQPNPLQQRLQTLLAMLSLEPIQEVDVDASFAEAKSEGPIGPDAGERPDVDMIQVEMATRTNTAANARAAATLRNALHDIDVPVDLRVVDL